MIDLKTLKSDYYYHKFKRNKKGGFYILTLSGCYSLHEWCTRMALFNRLVHKEKMDKEIKLIKKSEEAFIMEEYDEKDFTNNLKKDLTRDFPEFSYDEQREKLYDIYKKLLELVFMNEYSKRICSGVLKDQLELGGGNEVKKSFAKCIEQGFNGLNSTNIRAAEKAYEDILVPNANIFTNYCYDNYDRIDIMNQTYLKYYNNLMNFNQSAKSGYDDGYMIDDDRIKISLFDEVQDEINQSSNSYGMITMNAEDNLIDNLEKGIVLGFRDMAYPINLKKVNQHNIDILDWNPDLDLDITEAEYELEY